MQVAGVEQRQAHAGRRGRADHSIAEQVGLGVRSTVMVVVQVVKLADERDPGQCHLGERGSGQRLEAARVDRPRQLVHLLAPGPERARRTPRGFAPAQRPLEACEWALASPGSVSPGSASAPAVAATPRDRSI